MDTPELDDNGRRLVDAVTELLVSRGTWPTFAIVDRRLDRVHGIDAAGVLRGIPSAYVRRSRTMPHYREDDEVRLTLTGLAAADAGAGPDLDRLCRVVGWLAGLERAHDPDDSGRPLVVTSDEAALELGQDLAHSKDKLAMRRLWTLLELVPDIAAGRTWSDQPFAWQLTVSRGIRAYRDIAQSADLIRHVDEIWARADASFGMLPAAPQQSATGAPADDTPGPTVNPSAPERARGMIRPEAVDNFRKITSIPAVDAEIVERLRSVDERSQLEPALMRIIGEVDETPHGPTEIADITTVHLQVLGRPALGGVVIKGKALRTVRAKDVADQLQRAAALPQVGLIMLAAVGNIQDDTKQRLGWLADQIRADWLVLDRGTLARLLVAYGELCATHGTWLAQGPCSSCPARRSAPRRPARVPFTVLSLEDVSTGAAKRFGVHLLVPSGLDEAEIEAQIRSAIDGLRRERYSRSERVEAVHGDRLADVLFLYIYEDITDRPFANWVCRALWVSPDLDPRRAPASFGEPDPIDPSLRIDWNASHEVIASLVANPLDKGTYLRDLDRYRSAATSLTDEVRRILDVPELTAPDEGKLARLDERIDALPRPGRSRAAPYELAELDLAYERVDGRLVNLGLYFTPRGREVWPAAALRHRRGRDTLGDYDRDRTNWNSSAPRSADRVAATVRNSVHKPS